MSFFPEIPDFGEEIDSFFSELNALLDRASEMCLVVFLMLLGLGALWLVITLLGRGRR